MAEKEKQPEQMDTTSEVPTEPQLTEEEREKIMRSQEENMLRQKQDALKMGEQMIEMTLEVTKRQSPAIAAVYKSMMDALVAEGFSREEALSIVQRQNIGGQ